MATIAQKKSARLTSANTTLNCVFDGSVVAGAYIVVFVGSSVNYSGLSVADSQGNTYTLRRGDGFDTVWGRVYTAVAGSSGALTITVTQASGLCSIWAVEVNSFDNASSPEKADEHWQTISSGNSPYSPLNFTTAANANQLFLGVMFWNTGAARTWSGNTGWTTEDQYTAGDSLGSSAISRLVTDANSVAYDPEWIGGAGSHNNITLGLSIVDGTDGEGGGGGGSPLMGQACL